jgi:hypothetical protein
MVAFQRTAKMRAVPAWRFRTYPATWLWRRGAWSYVADILADHEDALRLVGPWGRGTVP